MRAQSVRLVIAALTLVFTVRLAHADIVSVSGEITAYAEAHNYPDAHQTHAPPPVLHAASYGTFANSAMANNIPFVTSTISLQATLAPTAIRFDVTGRMTVGGPTLTAEVGGQIDELFQLTAPADVELQHIHSTGNGVTFGVELLDASSPPVNTAGSAHIPAGQYRLRTTNTYTEGSYQDFNIMQLVVVSIPEPGTLSLALTATPLLLRRRRGA